jgi:hypothetical protein
MLEVAEALAWYQANSFLGCEASFGFGKLVEREVSCDQAGAG